MAAFARHGPDDAASPAVRRRSPGLVVAAAAIWLLALPLMFAIGTDQVDGTALLVLLALGCLVVGVVSVPFDLCARRGDHARVFAAGWAAVSLGLTSLALLTWSVVAARAASHQAGDGIAQALLGYGIGMTGLLVYVATALVALVISRAERPERPHRSG